MMSKIAFNVAQGVRSDIGVRLADVYPAQTADRSATIGLIGANDEIDFGQRQKVLHRMKVGQTTMHFAGETGQRG